MPASVTVPLAMEPLSESDFIAELTEPSERFVISAMSRCLAPGLARRAANT